MVSLIQSEDTNVRQNHISNMGIMNTSKAARNIEPSSLSATQRPLSQKRVLRKIVLGCKPISSSNVQKGPKYTDVILEQPLIMGTSKKSFKCER